MQKIILFIDEAYTLSTGATQNDFDKQGRITISMPLVNYASIKKECVIIGAGDRLEIWSKDTFDNYFNDNEGNISDIAENLFDSMEV